MSLIRAIVLGTLCLVPVITSAAIIVPGANGTDGALNITNNTVIDLSQAVTAEWDSDNSANAGKGVYDSNKWAVVFKYTSVNIASNVTVTFNNHPSRAPVVWLVSGDVTVNGTLSLNGQNAVSAPNLAEPGPGGFRGGVGYYSIGVSKGPGFGVGGGGRNAGGSYSTVGGSGPSIYGNPSVIPLVGGSGGGGRDAPSNGGGAGGGAILIASTGEMRVNGTLRSKGGEGVGGTDHWTDAPSGSGSGGAIRLVSDSLLGNGSITALGGTSGYAGGLGRIRIERVSNSATIIPTPDPSTVDLAPGATALLWPPTNAPQVRIVSISGTNAPADPRASFGTYGADVNLPVTTQAIVYVETVYVEPESQVRVRITPRDTFNAVEVGASIFETNHLSPLTLTWRAFVPANLGYSAVQAKVIRP
jgi:hypothetical protein